MVPAGHEPECNEEGGAVVDIIADVRLFNEADLATIEWFVDGVSGGFGETFSPFISLGTHTIDAIATAVQGVSDTDTVEVNVLDKTPPLLEIAFLNNKTGAQISQITSDSVNLPFLGAHVTRVFLRVSGDQILQRSQVIQ